MLFCILFIIVLLVLSGFLLYREIYTFFNHKRWSENAVPCEVAEIIDWNTEKVRYIKNDAKFKTTVMFSDGFIYVTFKTQRKDSLFQYRISVDSEEIAQDAMEAHATELIKLKQKGYYVCETYEEMVKLDASKRYKPFGEGWQCTCGRTHQSYESSCVCGVKKAEVKSMCTEVK